jgi:hypothetical protein
MAPFPSPHRLSLLGGVLAGAVLLLLPGCGRDGGATGGSAATIQTKAAAGGEARTTAGCPDQIDAFVDSLDTLRRQLAVGLSYEQYATRVKALRASYDQLPIDRLTIACLATTGTPAERAFDKYIDATNAWAQCLADASCATAAIEPVLQRKWRVASGFLSETP